jgi:hypothetical protein
MDTQQRRKVASLEGRRVNLALRGGIRIDDCQLVSAGRGRPKRLWVFSNGQDAFIPMSEVVELWEAQSPGNSTTWGLGQLIGVGDWRFLQ